jgi:hypothetical protein
VQAANACAAWEQLLLCWRQGGTSLLSVAGCCPGSSCGFRPAAHLCPVVSNSGTAPPLRPTEIASGSPSAGVALGATTLYWMLAGFRSGFAPGLLLVTSSGSSGSSGSEEGQA